MRRFIWHLVLPGALAGALALSANGQAHNFFPLADVKPGMRGIGRTVFSGDRIEEFQVEILGLLENLSPKQTIVLARLSGGPLAETGIMQGMSGSPVYIGGRLLGAVALGFPFSKEPIAGIQPIEGMVEDSSVSSPPEASAGAPVTLGTWRFPHSVFANEFASAFASHSASEAFTTPFGSLQSLLTPLAFAGFTAGTVQSLGSEFRRFGLQPLEGLSAGMGTVTAPGLPKTAADDARAVLPGSMISVGLLTGDLNMTADGTVTYVDGKKIYAFGHRFLDTGSTEIPFAHSKVIALIPNLNSSFKLSAPQNWVGTILSDRATAISGELNRSAHTVPLTISVHSRATGLHVYHFQVVNDRFITPVITQTALFSVVDATERTLGRGTLQLSGEARWEGNLPPLVVKDTFISDSGLIQQVSADAVVPLGFVLGAGFDTTHLKEMNFTLEASEQKRQLHVAQAWTSTHEVRPGESVQITALLQGENGLELSRSISYHIPEGLPTGPLNFTVSDGNTLNFPEFAGLSQSSLHDARSLIETINSFRDSDAVYLRVWRQEPTFTVENTSPSGELTDPPPSVALVLSDPSDSATSNAAATLTRGSGLAELSIPTRGYVVTGAKTLQVDVKE